MKKITMIACLALVLVFALSAVAQEDLRTLRYTKGHSTLHGGSGNPSFAKAGGDTINLMASTSDPTNTAGEPLYPGDFEAHTAGDGLDGSVDGWYAIDITAQTLTHFHIDTFLSTTGQRAWAGDATMESCGAGDLVGGYGSDWHDMIEFVYSVPNPGSPSTVDLTFDLQSDSEDGWDWAYFGYQKKDALPTSPDSWTGPNNLTGLTKSVTYAAAPSEYIDGDKIRLFFRFQSDGNTDNSDCMYAGDGGLFLDNMVVELTNGGPKTTISSEDFEFIGGTLGDPAVDGDSDYDWEAVFPAGAGNFAKIWENMTAKDPCTTNATKQVAFLDDGSLTGANRQLCTTYCYGPSGYVVNTQGGLAGPEAFLYTAIYSPAMDWPDQNAPGGILGFNVFTHEELSDVSPGIFYTWDVRSADTSVDPIEDAPWESRGWVYFGGPFYGRVVDDVTDLLVADRDKVQIRLAAYELGWVWGYDGDEATPAPYFDDVTFKVYPFEGPAVTTRPIDLANDGFIDKGFIDTGDLGSLHVRFDMARDISPQTHSFSNFGDSIIVDVVPVRSGAVLTGPPTLEYLIDPNPLFNPHRVLDPSALQGSVTGIDAVWGDNLPVPDRYSFDLPDSGLLFPGDVMHYRIHATDGGGPQAHPAKTTYLPADTTGYSTGFGDPMGYNSFFTIKALPTVLNASGDTPGVIFWNDYEDRGGENEWYTALGNCSMVWGTDYDIYFTVGPTSGVGNGLGGRAGTSGNLAGYDDLLYHTGQNAVNTISNGDFTADSSDDVGVINAWALAGDKDMFLTGDNLAFDLINNGGTATASFASGKMGVSYVAQEVKGSIANQAAPVVAREGAAPATDVFPNVSSWVAYGGCNLNNLFDALEVTGTGQRLARFTDPGGNPAYSFTAATLNIDGANNRVVSLPYDFMFIRNDPDNVPALGARAQMLCDVLDYFGVVGSSPLPSNAPDLGRLVANNYPNPFNPVTKIFYTMPKAGHLTLKVYNVRGQLVKTLIDSQVAAGENHIIWDGTNNQGAGVSSGVYFYEARNGSEVVVNKMALVK